MRYKIFGLSVESDLELTTGYPDSNIHGEADVRIVKSELPELEHVLKLVDTSALPINADGEELSSLRKIETNSTSTIVFKIGLIYVSNGNLIEYQLLPEADKLQTEMQLMIYAMTDIMIQRQNVMIHASGLVINDKAVFVCGESGSGKSTTANELLQRGAGFIADDSLPLYVNEGKVFASPAFPVRRLCANVMAEENIPKERVAYLPDGSREKYGVWENERYCAEDKEASGLFFIIPEEREDVLMERLSGLESIRLITACLFKRSAYKEHGYSQKLMTELAMIANIMPLYVIHRPVNGNTVKEIADKIENALNA